MSKKAQKIKVYNFEHSKALIEKLKACKLDFTVEKTMNSIQVKIPALKKTYQYIEESKSQSFMIYLARIKKEIEERKEKVLRANFSADAKNINYFDFSKSIYDMESDEGLIYEFSNVYEADISAAYYQSAFLLGFISFELKEQILQNLSKHERLRLLGCIATVKKITHYQYGEAKENEIKKNDLFRDAWFKICSFVDEAMTELRGILKERFLFYWVDGIYFSGDSETKKELAIFEKSLREIRNRFGFDFKFIRLEKMVLINKGNYLCLEVTKPGGETKQFFPKKPQVKIYHFENLNKC